MSNWSESQVALKLSKLRDRWFPKILIEVKESEFLYSLYKDGNWLVADDVPEARSIFEQKTFLIPETVSFFKLRRFPVESVSKKALGEAVELDLARWSPWQEDVDFYYWPKRCGEHWQVAVWVWQRSDLTAVIAGLESNPTHIMPELAWKLASLAIDQSAFVHIDSNGEGSWTYAEVAEDFSTLRLADIKNEADSIRFKTALGNRLLPVYVDAQVDHSSLSWEQESNCLTSKYSLPDSSALSAARQPGVSDWSDPFVWAKPTGAILALYILWLLGSGLVLLKQGNEVQEYSRQASSVSIEVLEARAEVERVNLLLERIDQMRYRQLNLESALASLSIALPRNAWLEHIEYRGDDGGWLEITGKSDQSTSLAAVLEQMPEVEQAMFLNDIRRDKNTGLEPFKIRLKLAAGAQ